MTEVEEKINILKKKYKDFDSYFSADVGFIPRYGYSAYSPRVIHKLEDIFKLEDEIRAMGVDFLGWSGCVELAEEYIFPYLNPEEVKEWKRSPDVKNFKEMFKDPPATHPFESLPPEIKIELSKLLSYIRLTVST